MLGELLNNPKSATRVPESPDNEQEREKIVTLPLSVASESVTVWLQHFCIKG